MLALLLASAIALLAGVQAQTAIEPEYNSAAYTVAISDAPARVDLPGLVNLTTGDDRVDYAPIGFQFVFFNRTFTSVNISSNGNLQFQTQVTGSANAFFGVSSTYSPAVAVFHTDLNPRNADSRQYATTGTAPNRQFIVRYNNVPYYSAGVNDTTLICDVVLYEGSNNIDMRWYNVPLRPTSINRNVEIGIQDVAQNLGANHLADWVALWNDRNFSAPETAALFNGKQARFTPLNSVPAGTPPPPTICTGTPIYGSRAYEIVVGNVPAMPQIPNAVNITSGDDRIDYTVLPFPFTFYGRTYNSVNVSTNGNAQFLTSETGSSGSFFLAMGTNPTYAPAIALFHADLNPNFVDARIYGTIGTAPNRQFIVRFNNVRYYGVTSGTGLIADMIFEEGTNNVVLNYYNVPVGTRAVEIGIQNSGNQSDWLAYWNDVAFSALCAESLNGKSLRFVPAGGVVPPPPSSSTGSVITPSSSTGAARSSSSSSVPVVTPSSSTGSQPTIPPVTPSSSTGSQPTIPPVTPSSSSVRGPSSSSGPVVFSSTAVPAPSSTGSVLPIPDGSAQVAMNIQLREPVTASNFLQTAANLERDFASNVAEVTGGDVDGIAQHVRCTNIGGLARPAARRLLQNNTPVTFVVLPSISQAVNMNNPADAVQAVTNTIQTRVQNGDFDTPNSGATVPAQTVTVTPVESNPDDGPNGSASVSALLALVVVAISMVLAL